MGPGIVKASQIPGSGALGMYGAFMRGVRCSGLVRCEEELVGISRLIKVAEHGW